MRKAWLTRYETSDQGTRGRLRTDSGYECEIAEPPYRNNQRDISCINPCVTIVKYLPSAKHPPACYHLTDIAGHSDIEIHKGNWTGDTSKGLKSDSKGCLIPGRAVVNLGGQSEVISSGDALAGLIADMEQQDFQLEILWGDGIDPSKSAA